MLPLRQLQGDRERFADDVSNRPRALCVRRAKISMYGFAEEIGCATWAQFFLKFVISHPAVTCAIPATSKVQHLADNMQASTGQLPAAKIRQRMATYVAEL